MEVTAGSGTTPQNLGTFRTASPGRPSLGTKAQAWLKDRATNQVRAKVVDHADAPMLQGFVRQNTEFDAQVYTDEARAYIGLPRRHETVRHSVGGVRAV